MFKTFKYMFKAYKRMFVTYKQRSDAEHFVLSYLCSNFIVLMMKKT